MLGDYEQAIQDFNKALEINPRHVSAYVNRGDSWFKKGTKKNACNDWKKACELGDCSAFDSARQKNLCDN